MLELTPLLFKERFWLSALVAFIAHSLVISALAFSFMSPYNGATQVFSVEMIVEEGSAAQEMVCVKPISTQQQTKKKVVTSEQKALQTLESSNSSNSYASHGESCEPLFNPPPTYPREARRKRMEGIVHIRLSVSSQGKVHQATVVSPRTNPLLEEAALQAVRQWKFKPYATTIEVPIEFKLEA
jgi:TonB family protein